MNKELFDEFVGELPPSSIDVDRVVAGRRRSAARRRLSTVGVATVVVAATAVIGFGPLPDNGPGPRAADQASAKAPPTGAVQGKRTAFSQLVAVDAAVQRAAPEARWPHATDRADRSPGFEFGEHAGHPASTYRVPLQVGGRTGTLAVRIIFDAPAMPRMPAGTVAAWIPMSDGRVLSVESSAQPGGQPRDELLNQDQVDSIARDLAREFRHG
jgi:hypothetical protein